MNEKVFKAYQKAINTIEDITEYRVYRPAWLKLVLTALAEELKEINNEAISRTTSEH